MIEFKHWKTEHHETLRHTHAKLILTDPRAVGYDSKRPYMTLTESYAVWEHKAVTQAMVIPRGYRTDLATVPRILWPLVSPRDLGRTGPLFHDWLIANKGKVKVFKWKPASRCWVEDFGARRWTRNEADRFFFRFVRDDMAEWKTEPGFAGEWQRWARKRKRRLAFAAVRSWSIASGGEWS